MMTQTFRTHTPEETHEVGEEIGRQLQSGDVVALIGDLGVGKTCLTQGIARGVGLDPDQVVNSPSYILINEYAGRTPIYHIDLYRLQRLEEIVDLGLEEYLEGDGICVIEWADRMEKLLPENYIQIRMAGEDEFTRTIEVRAVGSR
ncbi:MAG: tRNA (adenosine(37)-N6)-threonylcarbamoyltransferase complex ATPase subunit type 1 TsaE [Candidatus Poribacteria bacterium]|nr:tRNA (adenosine(37)-N6)-threonylcarbamoyltransferase complex ATPase subunit type 1 TsaE [Candidatus Poribacteria bacterium]